MIVELRVRDLATIADVTLKLGSGLTALTGETGAGKSLLADALALLLGARADSGAVRPGARRAVVEGAFESVPALARTLLARHGLDAEEDRVVVRREVSVEGRSRAWVNGSPTTAAVVADLGERLLDIHGQHDTLSLLRADAQRDILDAWSDAGGERRAVAEAWATAGALRDEEARLAARRDEVRRRADYLRHVVQEIDAARPVVGEDEALATEARRLGQVESLREHARALVDALDGGEGDAISALGAAGRALGALERLEPEAMGWRELLDGAWANLSELARNAEDYAGGLQSDPARFAEVERRRDILGRLMQKHGASVEAVLEARRQAGVELDLLDTADVDLRGLAARRHAADAALSAAAAALTARREDGAGRLGRAVTRMLPGLGLPGAAFQVVLEPAGAVTATGSETASFVARLNQGMESRPIARAASGGELSRLMLALRVVLAQQDDLPSVVFDEVDQGIGGEVGAQVADALAKVGSRRQVLVVTHLPQIAARADRHIVVSKQARAGLATSDVAEALGEDRVIELARMLGDGESATARRHAQELLAVGGSSEPASAAASKRPRSR
jgi:DNA repair protein RecN (Recombination protein N)